MRIVIQRVVQAKVEVEGKIVGEIGPGALVFFRRYSWGYCRGLHLSCLQIDPSPHIP